MYLPRLQSIAMVLGVFNLIIKKSETKEKTEKEEKINSVLPSHHPLLLLVPISPLRPRTELGFGRLCLKKKAYYAFSSAHIF